MRLACSKKAFICLHGVKIISLYTEAFQNICSLGSVLTQREILLSLHCIKILTSKLYVIYEANVVLN